jgi:hypothetical protein
MRRLIPIGLLAFVVVCPSIVICAVGTDNAIGKASRGNAVNTSWSVEELTLVVLSITAIAIGWYSYETRKLRIATERMRGESSSAREIEFHQWLTGSDLKIDSPDVPNPAIWLPVKNVGKTPAFSVSFKSDYYFLDSLRNSSIYDEQFIAPNDVNHFRIVPINMTSGDPGADRISVTITYSTHLKGSGEIKHDFKRGTIGWRNIKSDFTFSLSTGEKYSL